MQFIVNPTFTINLINTDIGIIPNLKFTTIQDVLEETSYETGIELARELSFKIMSSSINIDKLNVTVSKQKLLSSTDKKLLNLGLKNKRSSLLITDDKAMRTIAKENRIRCYTTPQFIAYLIKNELITRQDGLEFLSKLQDTYIRPKDIDIVMKRIKKWR